CRRPRHWVVHKGVSAVLDPATIMPLVGVEGLERRGMGTPALFGEAAWPGWGVLTPRGQEPFGARACASIVGRALVWHERCWHHRTPCSHVRMDTRRAPPLMRRRHAAVAGDLWQTGRPVHRLGGEPTPGRAGRGARDPG